MLCRSHVKPLRHLQELLLSTEPCSDLNYVVQKTKTKPDRSLKCANSSTTSCLTCALF